MRVLRARQHVLSALLVLMRVLQEYLLVPPVPLVLLVILPWAAPRLALLLIEFALFVPLAAIVLPSTLLLALAALLERMSALLVRQRASPAFLAVLVRMQLAAQLWALVLIECALRVLRVHTIRVR